MRKMQLGVFMQTATWLVSRELAEAAGPWDTKLLGDDDGEYFCRVLLASDGVRFVPESKVYYRKSGVNCLSYIGLSDSKMEAQMCSMQLHIRYLCSLEDSPRVREACVAYLQNWLPFFYPIQTRPREASRRIGCKPGWEAISATAFLEGCLILGSIWTTTDETSASDS